MYIARLHDITKVKSAQKHSENVDGREGYYFARDEYFAAELFYSRGVAKNKSVCSPTSASGNVSSQQLAIQNIPFIVYDK